MPLPRTPLLTDRLLLRPYEAADADAFFALLQHNRTRLNASFPDRLRAVPTAAAAPTALAAFAADWHSGRFYVLGIWLRATGAYLGDICLMPQSNEQSEIGYYLAHEAEGYGYAREALAAVCGFGFGAVASRRLLIRCFADNARGQAVALAAGFRMEKPATRHAWFRNADAIGRIQHFVQEKSTSESVGR